MTQRRGGASAPLRRSRLVRPASVVVSRPVRAPRQRDGRGAGRAAREQRVEPAGDGRADEPGVVVERAQRRDDQPAPRERAAGRAWRRRRPVPAAPVAVDAVAAVEIRERELLAAHEPVVGDEHAGDRAETARVARAAT